MSDVTNLYFKILVLKGVMMKKNNVNSLADVVRNFYADGKEHCNKELYVETERYFIKWERKTHYPWVVGYKRPSKSLFY